MNIEDKYFIKFKFAKSQVGKNLQNSLRDVNIAKKDDILDVKFNYAYTALIKGGIALLSYHNIKVKSAPGHHFKIIEKMAQVLKDDTITDLGNIMRSKRNLDLYSGGIEVTEKECVVYIKFVEDVIKRIEGIIK